ncbi:protein SLX4IP isoform X3 [Oryzias latipes]|uniref:protein SLX4IP isoform X3 n=1 Tax=Oryzias latipes TaxID=8090 RepID=UPI0009D9E5F8|nr:protein SLX4IP isoform X3 [Oryzias latipes]
MASRKIVIKCGNFAVLVDLHVLPLGSQKDASWFTVAHVEEVTTLVQDALDQRIRQYTEFLHSKKGCKQRREMTPPSGFSVRGENFNLVANFLKRHSNLRCVVKQDLRLFPERYVVCVSAPEDALLHHGNPSLVAFPVAVDCVPLPRMWFSRLIQNMQRELEGGSLVVELALAQP